MNYSISSFKLKIGVFFLIMTLIFWMIPSGLFGEGESSGIEVLEQALADANASLSEAQAAAESAALELQAAQAAADAANVALVAPQKTADEANAALLDAKAKAEEADAELAAAEQAVADAQAALDNAGEEDDLAALEQAVAEAKAARDTAKTVADEANSELQATQATADAASAALAAAQSAADAANAALEQAKAKDEEAKALVAEAEQAVADAKAALDAALAELKEKEAANLDKQEFNPIISTDKEDYAPEETVVITGEGFAPDTTYTIVVVRPDGSIVVGDGSFSPGSDTVTSDADGNFTYNYILNGIEGTYQVRAVDGEGSTVATVTFTDSGNDITVHKFGDTNGNEVQDSGEPNLLGVQFKLSRRYWFFGYKWYDYDVKTTDSSGNATWSRKPDGRYRVTELNTPPGYEENTGKKWEGQICSDRTINVPNTPESIVTSLNVTKTASASSMQTVEWDIDKTVDPQIFNLGIGETVTASYDVTVTAAVQDSGEAVVSGNIHIQNDSGEEGEDKTAFVSYVRDKIEYKIGGGPWTELKTVDISGPFIIATGGSVDVPYSVSFTPVEGATYRNTALVGLDNHAPPPGVFHEHHYTEDFSIDSMSIEDEAVTVTDSLQGSLGTVTLDDLDDNDSYTFSYDRTVGPYGEPGDYGIPNTATLTTCDTQTQKEDSANVDVHVEVPRGTITVIKNVIAPIPYNDDVSDDHSFSVVLQKAPNWWGPWTTVDSESIFGEGDNAVFTVDRGYWYRAVEGSDPDYIQGLNDGPVWLGYCDENKNITIKNRQMWALIKVNKEVVNHDGSDVDDNHWFQVKLESENYTTPLYHNFNEDDSTSFFVWPGTYTAAELGDDCYDLYDDGGSITVYSNDICGNELTVTNARKPGSITINKDGLVGDDQAVFTLYDGNGNPVGDPITLGNGGSDGWSELFWDSYTVEETVPVPDTNDYYYGEPTFDPEAPYIISCSICQNNLNQIVNVTNNDPRVKTAEIVIRKVVNGTPSDSDFIFTIDDGVNTPYNISIDGAGGDSSPITVEAGKDYTITENYPGDCWDTTVADNAPEGLIATDDELREASFTVDGINVEELDGSIITYTNIADPGKIVVHKEGMQLDDYAAFRLTGPNGYDVTKRVGGPSHWTTATFANLEWGTYTLTEVWVSEMDSNKYCYTSDLPEEGIEFTVECESLEHNPVVVNTPELGTIRVIKSGLELDDGAWFILKDSNGNQVSKKRAGTSEHWTTVTFSDLYRGSYILEELPTEGNYYTYKTNLNPGPYTIDCDNLYIEVPVNNNAEKGSITICKTDKTNGESLLGSTFELWKLSSNTQTEVNLKAFTAAASSFSSEWPKVVVLGVDTQGNCYTWEGLPYGTYMVKETDAPQGYKLFGDDVPPTGEIIVNINDETTNVRLEKEIANPRIPGSVTVIKKDESGNTMDGVGFTIYYKSSGNPVMPEKFTSGGLVTFSGLGWGEYIISETTVPSGYTKAGNVGVVIGPDNAESGVTVTINNSKTPPPPPPPPTTTTTTTGGGIEVLGIMELPFTGMNPAIPISGLSSILIGGFMVIASFIRRKFGRK